MNLKATLATLLGLTSTFMALAQGYEPYNWEETRSLTTLSSEEASFPLYQIQQTESYQFAYDEAMNNQLVCYITNHEIIRVNNDEALNQSNQVYIPMYNTLELVTVKARALTPSGQVINLDENNIKSLEDDESGYKIFAIEGAEVGGEIEFFYTRKTNISNFLRGYFQNTYPIRSYDFTLQCPENLEYDFKVYNHDGSVVQTDTTEDFNRYEFSASNIPDLQEENFGAYKNSKKRIEVKLAYNSVSDNSRLFTWGEAGKRIYNQIHELTKSEQKVLSKFIKQLDLTDQPIDAFKKAEHYIKTNYYLEETAGDIGGQLDFVIKNKYATSKGFTKLYHAILNHLNIQHEIILTADRLDGAFDPDFDTWNYLDEYLIYLNGPNMFMSPKDTPFRLGTIPTEYLGTYGLFIRPEQIQNFIYPIAHIDFIPAPPYTENFDNMDIEVSFAETLDQNTINLQRSYKGYSAEYYKAALLFLEEERKKEMLDDVIKYLATDAEIKNIEVSEANTDYQSWQKPLTVTGTFTTSSYIETAGDIILFKAGELIGPQSELYQERERNTQVVNDFNRGYLRKIKVNIPEEYTIQNPDDLIIKEQVFEEERLIFNFVSTYTINGQVLEIEIDEYYDELYYPAEKFEPFRKVINAAADWNKIVLVLKEK